MDKTTSLPKERDRLAVIQAVLTRAARSTFQVLEPSLSGLTLTRLAFLEFHSDVQDVYS